MTMSMTMVAMLREKLAVMTIGRKNLDSTSKYGWVIITEDLEIRLSGGRPTASIAKASWSPLNIEDYDGDEN